MAVLHAKKQLPLDTDFVHESITGETFTGRLHAACRVGDFAAVEPSISGRAWVTGYNTIFVHEQDPFPSGFTVGDVWGSTPTLDQSK